MLKHIRHVLVRWAEPELNSIRRLLKKAEHQLDHAMQENTMLKNRNEELNVAVNQLRQDNSDLQRQLELLKQANEMQGQTIDRMERHQREMQERMEHLLARVVRLEAELGRTPDFPIR